MSETPNYVELEGRLAELENLPHQLCQPVQTDENLMNEYKDAVATYLQRKNQHGIISRVVDTFDGKSVPVDDGESAALEEQSKALLEQQKQALQSISNKAALTQQQRAEIRVAHEQLQTHRFEFEQVMLKKQMALNEDSDNDSEEMDVGDSQLDEEEMKATAQKLEVLLKRKAQLAMDISSIRQQDIDATKQLDTLKEQLQQQALQPLDQMASENMDEENATMQSDVEKHKEIKSFYSNLRKVLEELSGVNVVEVQEGTMGTSNTDSRKTRRRLVLVVELFRKYTVKVTVDHQKKRKGSLVSASLSPTTLGAGAVTLTIPPLDDLVAASVSQSLRFFLAETMARVTLAETRLSDLTKLVQYASSSSSSSPSFVVKIGPLLGDRDQELVCSLERAQVTAVVRLTVCGGASLEQLVGLGGWDPAVLERMAATVNAAFAEDRQPPPHCAVSEDGGHSNVTPLALLQALESEIDRLTRDEGLRLPQTPRLPMRGMPTGGR